MSEVKFIELKDGESIAIAFKVKGEAKTMSVFAEKGDLVAYKDGHSFK